MAEWESEEWIHSARRLIEWVNAQDSEQPIMLMLRHSHREVMYTRDVVLKQGLTDLGRRMSFELGKKLPAERKIQIYHSYVLRCSETAEGISTGFTSIGGEVRNIDPEQTLVGPNTFDREVWKELMPDGQNVTDFVNRWYNGEFDDRIEPFIEFVSKLIEKTVKRLLAIEDNSMQVHVTHDFPQMCLLRILFDRELICKDREPFLGGIGVTRENGEPILFVKGEIHHLDNFHS